MADGLYGFTPNVPGIDQALSSGGVKAKLASICEPIAAKANANATYKKALYVTFVDQGTYVAIGKVVAANNAARLDNAHYNTLLKSR